MIKDPENRPISEILPLVKPSEGSLSLQDHTLCF